MTPTDPRGSGRPADDLTGAPTRFDALLADYLEQLDRGERPDRQALLAAHPELAHELADYFEVQDRMLRLAGSDLASHPTFGVGAGRGATPGVAPAEGAAAPRPAAGRWVDHARAAGGRIAERLDLLGQRLGGHHGSPADDAAGRSDQAAGAADAARGGSQPAGDEPLPPGSLLGQYRLGEVLGEGGMGRVYQATHLHLDRVLAVKLLAPRLARDPALVQRFHREARALASLAHPHIVAIHDMGTHGDMHYFVMEHVRGPNLRQLMRDGGLSPARALQLARQVCGALAFAHERGVVHRDIKPENILLDETGAPHLADFGLAKVLQGDSAEASAGLTASHVVLGTFAYMAPEQKHSAKVDGRADLYALGVVLYELLTGRLPQGPFEPPSRSAAVGPGLDRVVLKALQADPDARHQSAAELIADLDALLAGDAAAPSLGPGATPLPTSLRVIDRGRDAELGAGEASWLRLVMRNDDTLRLRTSPQPVVGVSSDAKLSKQVKVTLIEADTSPFADDATGPGAGLEVLLPKDDVEVTLPEGLPVVVVGSEADLDVAGLRGPLRIGPGSGDVQLRDHIGPLTIERLDDGDVRIDHLESRAFQIDTRDGDLVITGLRLLSGEGRLHTDDGDLTVGVVDEAAAFLFELRSAGGQLRCDYAQAAPGATELKGRVGEDGRARLLADSYSGTIQLGHSERLDNKLRLMHDLRKSGWLVFLLLVFVSKGWDKATLVVLLMWGANIGWRHLARSSYRLGAHARQLVRGSGDRRSR